MGKITKKIDINNKLFNFCNNVNIYSAVSYMLYYI